MINKKGLVSVIMNCFNGEKYLSHAVKSVLKQNYKNFEVIFWDNQSTDNSASIFKSFDDKRLKYFYAKTHTNLYEARNHAIEKSNGEYIAFLDTDDIWEHDKLSKQLPLFKNNKVGFVYSNYLIFDEIKNRKYQSKNKLFKGEVSANLLKNYFIGLLTLVIRRSAYENITEKFDPNLQIIGDLDFIYRLSLNWYGDFSTKNLAICRKHGENLLFKQSHKNVEELIYFEKKLKKYFDEKNLDGLYELQQHKFYLSLKENLKQRKYIAAIKNFYKIKSLRFKIKGIILFLLPRSLFK
tara:strand:- start:1465 stop:2349 length:885 start_codon:yes stop_codon:yes gene_type:complete